MCVSGARRVHGQGLCWGPRTAGCPQPRAASRCGPQELQLWTAVPAPAVGLTARPHTPDCVPARLGPSKLLCPGHCRLLPCRPRMCPRAAQVPPGACPAGGQEGLWRLAHPLPLWESPRSLPCPGCSPGVRVSLLGGWTWVRGCVLGPMRWLWQTNLPPTNRWSPSTPHPPLLRVEPSLETCLQRKTAQEGPEPKAAASWYQAGASALAAAMPAHPR